jgi:hypothetical protein
MSERDDSEDSDPSDNPLPFSTNYPFDHRNPYYGNSSWIVHPSSAASGIMTNAVWNWSVGPLDVKCGLCGSVAEHSGICPRVKAMEYHPNGTIKRIEFHD